MWKKIFIINETIISICKIIFITWDNLNKHKNETLIKPFCLDYIIKILYSKRFETCKG